MTVVHHYEKVDQSRIKAKFSHDRKHRYSLYLPFKDRVDGHTVCVIGQNPSYADEKIADKTLHYIEHLVYDKCPEVGSIVVLNLFSRVDTKKKENTCLLCLKGARESRKWIKECNDFILIHGKLKDQGGYRFRKRAQQIQRLLAAKHVLQLDIGTTYPPHPGNPAIYYGNYSVEFAEYEIDDGA
jgi:hypothetical protein